MRISDNQIQAINLSLLREKIVSKIKEYSKTCEISLMPDIQVKHVERVQLFITEQDLQKQSSVDLLCLWSVLFNTNEGKWVELENLMRMALQFAKDRNDDEERVFQAIVQRVK